MNAEFVRNRITSLRMRKGVSEYKMSYDLGHSRGYINNITSGKALPSLNELFAICEYFNITPIEFFDSDNSNPKLLGEIAEKIGKLNDDDLEFILQCIERMTGK